MSHEITTRPLLITDPDYDWGESITLSNYNYFFVPSIPEWAYSEFDGLFYEGVQYNWDEVNYRLSVDFPTVPEPSTTGLTIGLIILMCVAFKKLVK